MSKEFAAWLAEQLAEREMNQTDLWRRIGVTSAAVSRWLSGEDTPGTRNCRKIADAFRIDASEVLKRAGHLPGSPASPPPRMAVSEELAAEGRRLLDAARRVADLERQRVPARLISEPLAAYSASAQPRSGSPLVGFETRGGQWFFIYVEGDCLMPRVRPGAGLLFDREGHASVDSIVCVVVNGERHVKLIKAMNGLWTLADNHGELVLPVEDVTVEGVMVGEPWYQ